MTPDEMNPDICPSALEEDGTLDRSKWDGKHVWSEYTDANCNELMQECSECGTTRTQDMKCICQCGNEHMAFAD